MEERRPFHDQRRRNRVGSAAVAVEGRGCRPGCTGSHDRLSSSRASTRAARSEVGLVERKGGMGWQGVEGIDGLAVSLAEHGRSSWLLRPPRGGGQQDWPACGECGPGRSSRARRAPSARCPPRRSAPAWRATSRPPRNRARVGMLRMPKRAASAWLASVSSLARRTCGSSMRLLPGRSSWRASSPCSLSSRCTAGRTPRSARLLRVHSKFSLQPSRKGEDQGVAGAGDVHQVRHVAADAGCTTSRPRPRRGGRRGRGLPQRSAGRPGAGGRTWWTPDGVRLCGYECATG